MDLHPQNDDLSVMLQNRLHLADPSTSSNQQIQQPTSQPSPEPQTPSFTSSHYTHSAHLHHLTQTLPPSPSPLSTTFPQSIHQVDPTAAARAFLSAHSIDPSTLYPTQLRLFASADLNQQRRLVQLWTIAPPTGCPNRSLSERLPDWPQTSFELEEEMARRRHARSTIAGSRPEGSSTSTALICNHHRQTSSYDSSFLYQPDQTGYSVDNSSVATQADTPFTRPVDVSMQESRLHPHHPSVFAHIQDDNNAMTDDPEPYMATGYEALVQNADTPSPTLAVH